MRLLSESSLDESFLKFIDKNPPPPILCKNEVTLHKQKNLHFKNFKL